MSDHRTLLDDPVTRDATANASRAGVAATALAVVGLVSTYLLPALLGGGHRPDVAGFTLGVALTLGLAWVLFGRVVRGALRSPRPGNRPATVGFVTSLFAVLSLALFWLGFPIVTAGAGLVLGRRGRELGRRHGRRRLADAALAISAFVVLATVALLVNDALGHVGLGLHPPEE